MNSHLSLHSKHSFLLTFGKLSTRSDNLLCITLWLSINFSLYVIFLLSSSSLIGTEKVICFSVFSPKHLNWPLKPSANCLIMKWWSYVMIFYYFCHNKTFLCICEWLLYFLMVLFLLLCINFFCCKLFQIITKPFNTIFSPIKFVTVLSFIKWTN